VLVATELTGKCRTIVGEESNRDTKDGNPPVNESLGNHRSGLILEGNGHRHLRKSVSDAQYKPITTGGGGERAENVDRDELQRTNRREDSERD
jgi:hypothetical protein